jgi:hypothetical protein
MKQTRLTNICVGMRTLNRNPNPNRELQRRICALVNDASAVIKSATSLLDFSVVGTQEHPIIIDRQDNSASESSSDHDHPTGREEDEEDDKDLVG